MLMMKQYMTCISDIITELFTYLPAYPRREGINVYTNRMSVGEGEYLPAYPSIYLPMYFIDSNIPAIISLKYVMDSLILMSKNVRGWYMHSGNDS